MEKGRGKRADTLQTDKVITRNEFIEREAALKKLLQCADVYNPECSDITVAHAMRKISAIPSADVVPVRHGKWETAFLAHEYLGCRPYAHYCSVCHQIIAFRTFYCPNCGARMDGDSDGV